MDYVVIDPLPGRVDEVGAERLLTVTEATTGARRPVRGQPGSRGEPFPDTVEEGV